MPKFRVTGPDGATYEVNAPDGASESDVMAYVQQNAGKPSSAAADTAAWAKTVNPTDGMSTMDKFNAGAGKAFADIGLGVRQRLGMAPRSEAEEVKQRDAALMNTGAGVAGNIGGNVAMLAPAALIPGAATVPAAAAIGGTIGALQPSASPTQDALNIGLGAAGGAAGQALAGKGPGYFANRVSNATVKQTADAQKFAAAQAASKQGYVIPPGDLQPGVLSELASGFAGKIKTAQLASTRNQQVTDRLARQAIGLKPGDVLDDAVLQTIRNQAATQGYAPIRQAGAVQADNAFFNALDNIAATQQGAAKSFPGLADNGVVDLIQKLKQPAFDAGDAIDATKVLREAADKAYRQGDKTLGKASKQAADAIEDMLERHLTAAGNPGALKAFRDARALIAKTYSVQGGLNTQTGNVSARALAKQLEKGKPLTGELRVAAQAGQAFPRATQALKEAPKTWSPLDMAVGMGGGMMNPMLAAWLGRPLAREALLSGPVQQRAMQQSLGAPVSQAAQDLLESRMAQVLAAPAGIAGGMAAAR